MSADDERPLDEENVADLAEDLEALSNPHRLRLLQLLTRPRYRKEVGEELDMSRQAASRHVEKLLDRGFIRELEGWRESGPVKEYQVVPQRLFALGMALAEMGELEPEGGPDVQDSERTADLEDDEAPRGGDPQTARLLLANGPEQGETLPLEGADGRWTLGRDEDRDLTIDWDPYVSARHAEVHLGIDGHTVVDARSSNGTFVNFSRIPPAKRVDLEPGDVIRVGRTVLVYQAGGAAEADAGGR